MQKKQQKRQGKSTKKMKSTEKRQECDKEIDNKATKFSSKATSLAEPSLKSKGQKNTLYINTKTSDKGENKVEKSIKMCKKQSGLNVRTDYNLR